MKKQEYIGCWYCDSLVCHPDQVGLLHSGFPRCFVLIPNSYEFEFSSYEDFYEGLCEVNWLDPNDKGTPEEQEEVLRLLWKFAVSSCKEEVMVVRKARILAFNHACVMAYKVFADDMKLGFGGNWHPCGSSLVGDTLKIFFDYKDAKTYCEHLGGMKPRENSPVFVSLEEAKIEAAYLLDATDYESLKSVTKEAKFKLKKGLYVWPEYKSVEGAVILEWRCDTCEAHKGEFLRLRVGGCRETEEYLQTSEESRFKSDLVLESKEIEGLSESEVRGKLERVLYDGWNWINPRDVGKGIEYLIKKLA